MAKKFPSPPPDEAEGWLTSYADLMSLLSCFFMLMMAFANYEDPGFQQKAQIVANSFQKKTGGITDLEIKKLRDEIAHHPDFQDRMKISLKDGELRIVFYGSAVFPEGAYLLDHNTIEMVDNLIEMIKGHNTEYRILVEGHADKDESLLSGGMNHWSLSAARAATVIARFEYYGFKSEYMVALAKGDREPVAEYKAVQNGAVPPREIAKLNRRAVIRVLEPIGKKPVKMGLGVLFKDAESDVATSDSSLFKGEN
ncbi:MAG: flagellar motor protein MotB [Bacteriovoracaceae bacterium]